jgi:quercetin dioxygenase-like cupin family protein
MIYCSLPDPSNCTLDAMSSQRTSALIRRFKGQGEYRWEGTDLLEYKHEGTHFKDINRQILFGEEHGLESQWRYFEVAPGGHSTLERHHHVHAVMILRGSGRVLLEDRVEEIRAFDAVYVPPQTWHQFLASESEPLGFLCLVACDRDRPMRPGDDDIAALKSNPDISSHIRI